MERLTSRCAGYAVMAWEHEEKHTTQEWIDLLTDRLAAYEDTGYTPEDFDRLCREMSDLRTAIALPTYESLRDVIRSGRVILLPVKVDDVLYDTTTGAIRERTVVSITMLISQSVRHMAVHATNKRGAVTQIELSQLGKTVFMTDDEAKAALEKGVAP